MGLRFRQRIKVFPGVHLNVSLGGMSVSVGGPGATVNIGKGMRVRATVGLPGTGLTYQATLHPGTASPGRASRASVPAETMQPPHNREDGLQQPPLIYDPPALSGATWTPEDLLPVQELLIEAHQERQALEAELHQLQQTVATTQARLSSLDTWWKRWFIKRRIGVARAALQDARAAFEHVQSLERQQGVTINWSVDDDLHRRFMEFTERMRSLLQGARGWHLLGISTPVGNNRAWFSSPLMHRTRCSVGFGRPSFLCRTDNSLYENTPCITCDDGLSMYFYPTFILILRNGTFGLLPPDSLGIAVDDLQVAEHDAAYASARTDEYTWHYVNKNGSPDQRYTNNPRVPLINYQIVTLTSPQGLDERFLFTDNAFAFAAWIGVRDWYDELAKFKELRELPITPVQWMVRPEDDAVYLTAQQRNHEILGFGLTRHTEQFWFCINTEPMGVSITQDCDFHLWIDGLHMNLGRVTGITHRMDTGSAAFQIAPSPDLSSRDYMTRCLGSAKEAIILVRRDEVHLVRLRLALADPTPFWRALQDTAPSH